MLPILRIIPVGGVSLAIAILVLALSPPGGLRPPLTRTMMPARGALITRFNHPEWRQLLIHAALRRTDELNQLRFLPDTKLYGEIGVPDTANAKDMQTGPEVAGVPPSRVGSEPEDLTGTIAQAPDAAIPISIGETSSTELPVIPQEEKPPVILMPERNRPQHESLNVTPGSTKSAQKQQSAEPAQEQASVNVSLEPNKPAKHSVNNAPEPGKPAQVNKTAERAPATSERESPRRVRHRHYARATAKPPQPRNFNLFEILFASFNLEPQTRKHHR